MQIDSILYGYKISARFINFPSISMIRTMAEAQAKDKLCRVIDQVAKSIIKENGFQSEMKKKNIICLFERTFHPFLSHFRQRDFETPFPNTKKLP